MRGAALTQALPDGCREGERTASQHCAEEQCENSMAKAFEHLADWCELSDEARRDNRKLEEEAEEAIS